MKDKEKICPNCGYYCTGKSAFCNQPITMTKQNNTIENWEKWFDEHFTSLKFGDGSPSGDGKSAYITIKENISILDIKQFISNLVFLQRTQIEKEWKEKIKLPQDWRIGQTLFNFLAWLKENGYEGTARSSDMADPFYIKDVELLEKYNEYIKSQNKE